MLNEQYASLIDQNLKLKNEIESLTASKRAIEVSIKETLESAKTPLQNKIAELENNLTKFNVQSKEELSKSLISFENRIAALNSELKNKDLLINKINANLVQFDQMLTNSKSDNEKAIQEISKLKSENELLKTKNKDIDLSLQTKITQSNEPLLKQIELVEKQLKNNETISKERERTIKNMLSEKEMLNDILEKIKTERNELSTKLSEINNKATLEAKLKNEQLFEINKLREELKLVNKNNEAIVQDNAVLNKKITDLLSEITKNDSKVPEQLAALTAQNKKDIDNLKNQIMSAENIIKEKTAEIFKITDEKNQIRSKILDITNNNKLLNNEIISLKNTVSKFEGSSANIELAKLPLEEKIDQLNLALNAAEEEKKTRSTTIENLKQKLDNLNKELSLILSEKVDLNEAISSLKKQYEEEAALNEQRSAQETIKLNNEIQQLKNELASIRNEGLDIVNETTEKMSKELTVLKNELDDSNSIIKNKDYKIKSLYDNISDLESKLNMKIAEIDNSGSNIIKLKNEIKRLSESFDNRLQSEKTPLVEEVNTLKSELKQMDRLVRVKVEETKESLQRQLTALEQQLKSNEIAILEKDNKNAGLTQEIIKLNASIDQLIVDKNSMEKALYSLTDKYEKTIIMYKENVSELEMINSSNNLEKENERSIKSEIDDALKLIEIYK